MVKPVAGSDDLFSFRFDFIPEGKALDDTPTDVVTEQENGDLIIEGWAAVFEGQDRQNENFIDGAFSKGIKAFLGGQAALCYHHDTGKCLGSVMELEEVEGKGLRMKARVDGAIRKHPELGTYYEQIKKGTLRALSVGGFFKRKLTAAGQKIAACDFTEISVTPVPIHPGTNFAVVAGKALKELPSIPEGVEDNIRKSDEDQINWVIDELGNILANVEAALNQRKQTTEATQ
jgi:HK97 family phage prohead protease